MKLEFDLENMKTVEFGVACDEEDQRSFYFVATDSKVQAALREMVVSTTQQMQMAGPPQSYEPGEKHASKEYLLLPLDSELATEMKELQEASNLTPHNTALSEPASIFAYFARLTDKKGRRLTALRRAMQFKGVLKSRLIQWVTDSVKLVEDNVFKLDTDFDILIDAASVHILRPASFEFVSLLQAAVMAEVPKNIKAIQRDLKYVDFADIEKYASKHPRAARYLASIRAQGEAKNVDKARLKRLCKQTGVNVRESAGRLHVEDGHVMQFLEVLDRRRYEIELVKESPERYRAPSRQRLDSE